MPRRALTKEKLKEARAWAATEITDELRALYEYGHACQVQEWAAEGYQKIKVAECAERRREASRLLTVAIRAVQVEARKRRRS